MLKCFVLNLIILSEAAPSSPRIDDDDDNSDRVIDDEVFREVVQASQNDIENPVISDGNDQGGDLDTDSFYPIEEARASPIVSAGDEGYFLEDVSPVAEVPVCPECTQPPRRDPHDDFHFSADDIIISRARGDTRQIDSDSVLETGIELRPSSVSIEIDTSVTNELRLSVGDDQGGFSPVIELTPPLNTASGGGSFIDSIARRVGGWPTSEEIVLDDDTDMDQHINLRTLFTQTIEAFILVWKTERDPFRNDNKASVRRVLSALYATTVGFLSEQYTEGSYGVISLLQARTRTPSVSEEIEMANEEAQNEFNPPEESCLQAELFHIHDSVTNEYPFILRVRAMSVEGDHDPELDSAIPELLRLGIEMPIAHPKEFRAQWVKYLKMLQEETDISSNSNEDFGRIWDVGGTEQNPRFYMRFWCPFDCPICLDPILCKRARDGRRPAPERLAILECFSNKCSGSIYHYDCMIEYLTSQMQRRSTEYHCPVCRHDISPLVQALFRGRNPNMPASARQNMLYPQRFANFQNRAQNGRQTAPLAAVRINRQNSENNRAAARMHHPGAQQVANDINNRFLQRRRERLAQRRTALYWQRCRACGIVCVYWWLTAITFCAGLFLILWMAKAGPFHN